MTVLELKKNHILTKSVYMSSSAAAGRRGEHAERERLPDAAPPRERGAGRGTKERPF